jgi:DNA-binding SARP family transcriptional activator
MQLCAPANAALPLSQPLWHPLVLVRPPHLSDSLADGRVLGLASWPMVFVLGALAGAIVVVLTRAWLRLRARNRRPDQVPDRLPQPASAPVAVASPRAAVQDRHATVPARNEGVPARHEAPREIVAGAEPQAQPGTVLAVRRLLADLEDLKVTLADGPPALVERLLTTVAAQAGDGRERREVILVGFDAHGDAGGQINGEVTCQETLSAALDLIAARTVRARRSLAADPRLTLLVSRIAPARSELSLLIDLVNEPGRVAALLALGSAPVNAAAGQVAIVRVRPGLVDSDLEASISQPALQADLVDRPPVPEPSASNLSAPADRDSQPELQRPKPPAALRIGMLGQLTINGQPGALLPAQTQLIVALAVNGSAGLSNAQLCDLLGADAEHPKPADSLRQLIARTRRQLGRADDGKEWIVHLGHGQYALHPGSRVDWHEFKTRTDEGIAEKDAGKLAAALAMIRGQPFTGCYYWWLDIELVDSVSTEIVTAATALAELALAKPDPPAAARAARIGLVADGTAEELWRLLMRAEHAAGNLAGVREAWSRCVDAVAEIAADGQPQRATAALYHCLVGRTPAR